MAVIAVGFGARSAAGAEAIGAAIDVVLAESGWRAADVSVLATIDRRAGAAGVREMAAARGWRLAAWTAEQLASVPVPRPSGMVAERVGSPSVAEAAALLAVGTDGELVVGKRTFALVTVAVARGAAITASGRAIRARDGSRA